MLLVFPWAFCRGGVGVLDIKTTEHVQLLFSLKMTPVSTNSFGNVLGVLIPV